MSEKDLFNVAGNLTEELSESSLESISGAGDLFKKISKTNNGKYCSITWECGICPTHTCWC